MNSVRTILFLALFSTVQVLGTKPVEISDGNILTSDLVATQNTVGHGGVPSRAIDGNVNRQWGGGSCTHSSGINVDNNWKVALGRTYAISKVVIYNREDCCQNRINEAKVYVGAVYCGDVTYKAGKSVYEVDCGGALGKSIEVKQPYNYLTLCEVQAFGEPSDGVPLKNVALGKPTSARDAGWGGIPSRAVDGGISGDWGRASCTHSAYTGYNIWWVRLMKSYAVDSVVLYNRRDCCKERLAGAKVYVDGKLCGVVRGVAAVYRISCGNARGSSVKITHKGQYLTLCEVQVLAK